MRSATDSTIMIRKTLIWYLSTQWKKTETDYPVESCQGPGRPYGHWKFGLLIIEIFEQMVCNIKNCPVTIDDIQNSNTIYGCYVTTLKWKKVRQQPKRIQAEYI